MKLSALKNSAFALALVAVMAAPAMAADATVSSQSNAGVVAEQKPLANGGEMANSQTKEINVETSANTQPTAEAKANVKSDLKPEVKKLHHGKVKAEAKTGEKVNTDIVK